MSIKIKIHIGTPKTGSASIQKFLDKNHTTLIKNGVLFPKTYRADSVPHRGRSRNHLKLAAFAINFNANKKLYNDSGIEVNRIEDIKYQSNRVKTMMADELAQYKKIKTIIFSSEHLSNHLYSKEEIERVADHLYSIWMIKNSIFPLIKESSIYKRF